MAQVITDKQGIQHYMITINVNGDDYTRVVKANTLLVNVLRDELDLTGTKKDANLVIAAHARFSLKGNPLIHV
jgi:Aerobic-type carbon monoxide dehydrogenase, small subunit CoxS/CutS homologs